MDSASSAPDFNAVRRDSLGRRIGRNWWREMNCAVLLEATLMWEEARDAVAIGYETERAEYERDNPRPNLKSFLIFNKGLGYRDR